MSREKDPVVIKAIDIIYAMIEDEELRKRASWKEKRIIDKIFALRNIKQRDITEGRV